MKINDELLSAYLDNELSEQDLVRVQNTLRDDAAAADRLSQLASINALVGTQAALIDSLSMPESVMALLRENHAHTSDNNVVELSRFRQVHRRFTQALREQAALAATLALLLGFAAGQMLPSAGSSNNSALNNSVLNTSTALYAALDTTPSGQPLSIDANTELTARFSFQDTQSRYCRQFLIQDNQGSSENIACRDQDQWTLLASARSSALADSEQYQPASGQSLLDTMLDAMMQGSALSQTDEQTAINSRWHAE